MISDKALNEARDSIAGFIVSRRNQLGLTQQELAERADLGIATVKRIELAKYIPDGKSLLKLCHALGCLNEFLQLFKNGAGNE